ncbi:MAG: glycosyltransferase [Gemmatimonadales bacterium]|nr:glycosyltransferase [Gemmatimonadales bacterium]
MSGASSHALTPGLVTVVMAAYNVGPFVTDAIRSVLSQTYVAFELLVIDDGSTDDTGDRVAGIRDPRLRLIQQANAGLSAARNTGIAHGTGELIAFIDGDDVWLPDKLARQVAYLRAHPEADLTFAWSRIVDEGGRDTGRTSARVSGVVSFERLFALNVVGNGSAVVLRRDVLDRAGTFDEQLRAEEDHDVWLRVSLLRPDNVHCVPEVLSLYRMRVGQMSKDWRRMETAWHRLLDKMRALAAQRVAPVETEARSRMYRYLAYIAYEGQEYAQAAAHLRTAVVASPTTILRDRGTWLVGAGVLARAVLPPRVHLKLDGFARRLRSLGGAEPVRPAAPASRGGAA